MQKDIKEIIKDYQKLIDKEITIEGWVRKHRKQKQFGFMDISDGTSFEKLQIIYDKSLKDFDFITKIRYGSSVRITGILKETGRAKPIFELQAKKIELIGKCPDDYPMQDKEHSMEFFRIKKIVPLFILFLY